MKRNSPIKTPLKSVEILSERINTFFLKKDITHWCYLSISTPKPSNFNEQPKHVVLLGDAPFFFSFAQFGTLKGDIFFWTLSTALKDLLVNYVGIPSYNIGIIPRYELFPQKMPQYKLSEIDSLVYAGRDVNGKYFNLAKKFASLNNLPLEICGPGLSADYGHSWVEQIPGKPAFITLSHYRYEDFSVAIAEAQAFGMPVICPSWFCFKDIEGESEYVLRLKAFPFLSENGQKEQEALLFWKNELITRKKITASLFNPNRVSPKNINSLEVLSLINSLDYSKKLALYEYFSDTFSQTHIDRYSEIISNML